MSVYEKMPKAELEAELDGLRKEFERCRASGLKLNMSRGVPGVDQLELSMPMLDVLNSSSELVSAAGVDYRNYGIIDGIDEAKQMFADLFGVSTDEIIVGGNSSLNMMFDTVSSAIAHGLLGSEPWVRQGKVKFLCPSPGYDRHFSITEYLDIEMVPVEMRDDGPDMDTVERLVNSDPLVKGIWCVPKYANPTGIVYSDETVRRFANLRPAAEDFRIFWDNAYCIHHLFGEDKPLLNLLEEAKKAGNPNMVYMYFSTSKITFPGAGISGMATSAANVQAIKKRMSMQTIGPDKLNQLRHMRFFGGIEGLREHMNKHAGILRHRFIAVADKLEEEFGGTGLAAWTQPHGGYFISLDVPEGCAKKVITLCKEAGLILTEAGATYPYHNDPRDSNVRIAPTAPTVEDLKKAIHVLAVCTKIAAAEQLI